MDEICNQNNIKHKLIPPGEKELQGLVERSHRQDDQELFSRITPFHLDEFKGQLQDFTNQRNDQRRFKKLNWKTPNQWLENYLTVSLATILLCSPSNNGVGQCSRNVAEILNLERSKLSIEAQYEDFAKNDVNIGKVAA